MTGLRRAMRFLMPAATTLLALAATGGTGGTCDGGGLTPQLQVCTTVSDCPRVSVDGLGQWACIDGGCQWQPGSTPECATAADCSGKAHDDCTGAWSCASQKCAWTCDSTPPVCVASGCSGELCATAAQDSDCVWKDWFACLKYTTCGLRTDGTCGFADSEAFQACLAGATACGADSACPAGYACLDGVCTPASCIPSEEVCDGIDNDCNGVIDDGCGTATCTVDADCASQEYCDLGGSAEAPGCCVRLDDGTGCPPDYPECVGTCRPRTDACVQDSDCGSNQACVDGTCLPIKPPPCSTDSQCAPGKACINGVCLTATTCTVIQPGSHGSCEMVIGWAFDGTACRMESGCGCAPDCAAFFQTQEACAAACGVPLPCTSDVECGPGSVCMNGACVASPACRAVQPGTHGDCKMMIGIIFDGRQCVSEGGCQCEPDCDAVFPSMEACAAACGVVTACAADSDCPVGEACVAGTCQGQTACTPVKPYSHGMCEMIIGVIFDGAQCTYESGCSCQPDCNAFFKDVASCQSACING